MWYLINGLQIILVTIYTFLAAILGSVVFLFTWNQNLAMKITPNYFWSPLVFATMLTKLKVRGRKNIEPKSYFIYVSNHESSMDIPSVFHAIGIPLFFIAKKELKKVPFMGWYMAMIGMIFIDRSNREKALASMRKAGEMVKAGKNVISFPEGTRNTDGKIGVFKRGSFLMASSAGVGVVPVAIKGAREIMPAGSYKARPGTIHVSIGKPMFHSEHPELSVDQWAAFVRDKVVELRNELPETKRWGAKD
jgi:1-acyl-sn-glycerol-3-phosphate acyltransferase